MKIVINACYGGFHPSHKAIMRYAELSGFKLYPYGKGILISECAGYSKVPTHDLPTHEGFRGEILPTIPEGAHFWHRDIERNDPNLVKVVEELGREADTSVSSLKVVEIPDGVEWTIEEYDGFEHIAEKHKTWG